MPHDPGQWVKEFPVAVTVTAADGTIVEMNDRSLQVLRRTEAQPSCARASLIAIPRPPAPRPWNSTSEKLPITTPSRKKGQKKIIHQIPWTQDGAFAGFVEISIPIPDELPHFDRGLVGFQRPSQTALPVRAHGSEGDGHLADRASLPGLRPDGAPRRQRALRPNRLPRTPAAWRSSSDSGIREELGERKREAGSGKKSPA